MTEEPKDSTYSSVVSLRSMRIAIFLSELNGLSLCAGDVGNAYLGAKTKENVCCIGGSEFREYGLEGHLLVIVQALYGLKSSGARFHETFSETMNQLGYKPSKADPDVWIKDCDTHYEYVCTYVDDLLCVSREPEKCYASLEQLGYKLKGVKKPDYHLGGDFKYVGKPEKMLTWGAHTYIKKMMYQYEKLFGVPVPKREIHAPLEPRDHPELDDSELLDVKDIKVYQTMIGTLQWAVSLGRMYILCATMTMSRFHPAPRKGYLERLKRIYSFLRNYKKTAIKFNTEMPDYSKYKKVEPTWGHVYHPCKEDIPPDMLKPKGKPVLMTTFFDANLMHDIITGRSCTGIMKNSYCSVVFLLEST